MKLIRIALSAFAPMFVMQAQAQSTSDSGPRLSEGAMSATPALRDYTQRVLFDDLWKRPGLSQHDRSLVTIAAVVAEGRANELPFHLNLAIDNGVSPSEIAGAITHLAFYSGWPYATAAEQVAEDVFAKRGISANQVASSAELLPVDRAADAPRAERVDQSVGPVAPDLARYTNELLFNDLWRRADLAPRDRSMITITALIVGGNVDQLPFHLERGMQNGLTRAQLSEMLTHLAFYAGWPRTLTAVPVVKKALDVAGK